MTSKTFGAFNLLAHGDGDDDLIVTHLGDFIRVSAADFITINQPSRLQVGFTTVAVVYDWRPVAEDDSSDWTPVGP